MKNDLCLEIGCEEIPARFIQPLSLSLVNAFETECKIHRLQFDSVSTEATYRRLVLYVRGLNEKQEDMNKWVSGPPQHIAFDEKGVFTKAAIGFAKKNNIDPACLEVMDVKGKKHVGFNQYERGKRAQDVLPALMVSIIRSIPLPIAMRWADRQDCFVRPIHWICCLFGNEVIPFSIFGVTSGQFTYGHRFLTRSSTILGEKLQIQSSKTFMMQLEKEGNVIIDVSQRHQLIEDALNNNNQTSYDRSLLAEVIYLTEYPTLLKGQFDQVFLQLPDPILVECMRKHQRYFPMLDQEKLLPQFLVVADNVTSKNARAIIEGNQRVLRARLQDALFFYDADKSKSFDSFSEELKTIVFHKGCGTLFDKQQRIAAILGYFSEKKLTSLPLLLLDRMATLSKADLVTQMVVEFPALQGKIGEIYARLSNEDPIICRALSEQYMPIGAHMDLPQSHAGIMLALADRFDTVVALFNHGVKPTGSQDPFGLRRAINSILMILDYHQIPCDLCHAISKCYSIITPEPMHRDRLDLFLKARIKTYLMEKEVSYDVSEAVSHVAMLDVNRAAKLGKQIDVFRKQNPEEFKSVVETAVRINRLASKAGQVSVNPSCFSEDKEMSVYDAVLSSSSSMESDSLNILVDISIQLKQYFESILVMVEDDSIRKNRLAFLSYCDDIYMRVANFECIVV